MRRIRLRRHLTWPRHGRACPGHPRQTAASAGFTLLETLAVMAIFALVIGISTPLLRPAPGGLQLQVAARRLCATMRDARARAIAGNNAFPVTFNVARKSYWTPALAETFLPPQAQLDLKISDARRQGPQQGDILFFPGGASTGGEVTLSLGGRTAIVDVNWLTGAARCEVS
jgi:general secretion pathway protein H